MKRVKEKIDPSRESEPKDFHLNYSLVGLSLKCLHFLSYKSETTFNFRNVIVKPTRLNNLLDPIIISDTMTPLYSDVFEMPSEISDHDGVNRDQYSLSVHCGRYVLHKRKD
jgi:hypothetical protein